MEVRYLILIQHHCQQRQYDIYHVILNRLILIQDNYDDKHIYIHLWFIVYNKYF